MLLASIAKFLLWFNRGFLFLKAKPNLHIIDIILTFMFGIYNYLCTVLDVHQVVHLCTLLVLLVLSDTPDPKIPTFCKFIYFSFFLCIIF